MQDHDIIERLRRNRNRTSGRIGFVRQQTRRGQNLRHRDRPHEFLLHPYAPNRRSLNRGRIEVVPRVQRHCRRRAREPELRLMLRRNLRSCRWLFRRHGGQLVTKSLDTTKTALYSKRWSQRLRVGFDEKGGPRKTMGSSRRQSRPSLRSRR